MQQDRLDLSAIGYQRNFSHSSCQNAFSARLSWLASFPY